MTLGKSLVISLFLAHAYLLVIILLVSYPSAVCSGAARAREEVATSGGDAQSALGKSGGRDAARSQSAEADPATVAAAAAAAAATQQPQFIIGKIDVVTKELTIIVKEEATGDQSLSSSNNSNHSPAPRAASTPHSSERSTPTCETTCGRRSGSAEDENDHDHDDGGGGGADSAEKKDDNTIGLRTMIDETTRVIFVDGQTNESGILWGTTNDGSNKTTNTPRQLDGQNQIVSNHQDNAGGGAAAAAATNYSLYLISRNKDHIAMLIDIVDINFEPSMNCESQELKFSIVGEISKQLLERKDGTEMDQQQQQQFPAAGAEVGDPQADQQQASAGEDALGQDDNPFSQALDTMEPPPLPVSEAMTILMNAPINMTILDRSTGELNDFQLIDTTIDYLHEETCRELRDLRASNASRSHAVKLEQPQQRRRSQPKSKHHRRRKHKRPKSPGRRRHSGQRCNQQEQEFKDLLSSKLDTHLEWDDFKIVCGRVKQLVIPMRSLKLSITSDEFSPRSNFSIRYEFISDPNRLPTLDNGNYFCRNRNVIDLELKCDGYDDCGDGSDESIKICGYPSGVGSSSSKLTHGQGRSSDPKSSSSSSSSSTTTTTGRSSSKLIYYSGGVAHCCQSSDWQNAMASSQGPQSQMLNLQTIVGESMRLFSGPLFAPTQHSHHPRRIKRVVGGTEAHRGTWPGQVSLQYELLEPLGHFCAGTLIHPHYVLTAGHCVTKEALSRGVKVVFGAHDLGQTNGTSIQTRYVDDAQIYPGVDVKHLSFEWENDMNNDIALLRLNAPVMITPQVAPACLPPPNTPLSVNTTCRSIGWGQTHGSGGSNLLKYLPLRVEDSSQCYKQLVDDDDDDDEDDTKKNSPRKSNYVKQLERAANSFHNARDDIYSNRTMVCVNSNQGHGICQGDSGGPLYCDRITPTGEHCTEIYGVASFIIQYATVSALCGVENLPGIYGEVSSKTEWISSTIKMFEQSYRLKFGSK